MKSNWLGFYKKFSDLNDISAEDLFTAKEAKGILATALIYLQSGE